MSLFRQQNIQFWNVLFEKKTPIGQAYKKQTGWMLTILDYIYLHYKVAWEKKPHKGQIKDRGH